MPDTPSQEMRSPRGPHSTSAAPRPAPRPEEGEVITPRHRPGSEAGRSAGLGPWPTLCPARPVGYREEPGFTLRARGPPGAVGRSEARVTFVQTVWSTCDNGPWGGETGGG